MKDFQKGRGIILKFENINIMMCYIEERLNKDLESGLALLLQKIRD